MTAVGVSIGTVVPSRRSAVYSVFLRTPLSNRSARLAAIRCRSSSITNSNTLRPANSSPSERPRNCHMRGEAKRSRQLRIRHHHAIGAGLDQSLVLLLAFPGAFVGPLAFSTGMGDRRYIGDLPLLPLNRSIACSSPGMSIRCNHSGIRFNLPLGTEVNHSRWVQSWQVVKDRLGPRPMTTLGACCTRFGRTFPRQWGGYSSRPPAEQVFQSPCRAAAALVHSCRRLGGPFVKPSLPILRIYHRLHSQVRKDRCNRREHPGT